MNPTFPESEPERSSGVRANPQGRLPLLLLCCSWMLAGAGMAPAAPTDGNAIVINEIFADPPDAERDAEFVELFNRSREDVDLSGWRLTGAVNYSFPSGSLIEAGGYAVVALAPAAVEAAFGVRSHGPWSGRLGGEGEKLRVLDAAGNEVDEVEYGCGFPWPVVGDNAALEGGGEAADEAGVEAAVEAGVRSSLELVHPESDNGLGGSWRESPAGPGPSPGARNGSILPVAPPVIVVAGHAPEAPAGGETMRITAEIRGAAGMPVAAELRYQIVPPGEFLPAWTAQPVEGVEDYGRRRRRAYDGALQPTPNPAFEAEESWTAVPMSNPLGDRFEAEIPGQPHRTLVRYRVFASANGVTVRAPLPGDPSLNFACYVSDGIPDYETALSVRGRPRVHAAAMLTKLPVYALISRAEDVSSCMGHERSKRLDKGSDASKAYNWEGALVSDGVVYDHIRYRLRGGNGRYLGNGRRSMKFRFNKGRHFAAKDQQGREYAGKWRVLECSKMFSNRMVGNFGLVDSINGMLWRMMDVPAPHTHWFHFRVVDAAAEAPDQWSGDFWGLMLAQEHYDKRFLEQHGLEKGNLYKLSDGVWGGESQARYLAPEAVDDFSDYDAIEYDLTDRQAEEWIREHVDIDHWARFSAVKEAVRHYDFWPGANKNMVYYFEPVSGRRQGRLRLLPYDHDDTWGPCWNHGVDCVSQAVQDKDDLLMVERNVLREFRDLVWQSDQLNPMLDDLARTIAGFVEADYDRWWHAPYQEGRENYGTLESKVEDMKRFAWYGGYWPGGSVRTGGRARFLDERAADPLIPITPKVAYSGGSGFPRDALQFDSSAFASPAMIPFGTMQWRLAVITPPARNIDPFTTTRRYEWDAAWESGELPDFSPAIRIPPHVVQPGDLCRVRVRHRDLGGRWSHWSKPCEFTASEGAGPALTGPVASLLVTEVNYHPRRPTAEEAAAGFSTKDFEWLEVCNPSEQSADLSGVRFTKGINFAFPPGGKLLPGERLVLVRNARAFALRYGVDAARHVHGEWEAGGALSDSGERIRLKAADDSVLCEFVYDNGAPWPGEADGGGSSLQLLLLSPGIPANLSEPEKWRASREPDGTPGS